MMGNMKATGGNMKANVMIVLCLVGCSAPAGPATLPAFPPGSCASDPAPVAACSDQTSHTVYGVIGSIEYRSEPIVSGYTLETVERCEKQVRPGVVMTLRAVESWNAASPRIDETIEVVLQATSGVAPPVAIDGERVSEASLVSGTTVGMWLTGPLNGTYMQLGPLFTMAADGVLSYQNMGCEQPYRANTKREMQEALLECKSAPPTQPLVVAFCDDEVSDPAVGCSRDSECGAGQQCDSPTGRCIP
jgi:hypothetical protein